MAEESPVCRVCMRTTMECVYLGALLQEKDNISFCDGFNLVTQLNAQEGDELPGNLCFACADDLKVAFQFIKRAINSDQILRNTLNTDIEQKASVPIFNGELSNIKEEEALDIKEEPVPEIEENYSAKEGRDDHIVNSAQLESDCPNKTELQNATNGRPAYERNICGESYYIKGYLKSHMATHTKNDEQNKDNLKNCVCDVCGKTLASPTGLRIHKLIHAGDKKFECNVCPFRFTTNYQLQYHMTIHTDERPFKCSVCGSEFARNSYLKVHMRTHTGEKPYECKICGKAYPLSYPLKKHMVRHAKEKVQCRTCGKKFCNRTELVAHRKKYHAGITYKCTECSKVYLTKGSLKTHMLTHMDQKPFNCEICSKSFTRKEIYKFHLKRVHDKD